MKRWFSKKPRLDSNAPEDRLRALASGDVSGEALARLAREDADVSVRRAAIAAIDDVDPLEQLLDDADVGNAAAIRYLELKPEAASHPALIRARVAGAPGPAALPVLFETLDDEGLCTALLACREQWRAELLPHASRRGEAMLSRLERSARNRCKTTNRFARSQLAELKRVRDAHSVAEHRATELAAALGRDAQDTGRREVLTREADALLMKLQGFAEQLSAYGEPQTSAAVLQDALAALPEPEPEPEPVTAEDVATEPEPPADDPGAIELLTRLEACLADGGLDPTRLATLSGELSLAGALSEDAEVRRQRALADTTAQLARLEGAAGLTPVNVPAQPDPWPSAPEDLKVLWRNASQCSKASRKLEKQISALNWPKDQPEPPALQQRRSEVLAARQFQASVAEQREALEARLDETLTQATKHLEAGELNAARSVFGQIRKLDSSLPGHPHQSRMSRTAAQLGELADWATFAIAPKRQQLLERIEQLAAQPLAPPEQATAVKAARSEWRELGRLSSREAELAERFDGFAEQAFAPCRTYFEQQAEQRAENLAARAAICDQLDEYVNQTDWQNTDMKAAERIMRAARTEWQNHGPVDRKRGRSVEQRFEALQQALSDRVNASRTANLEAKQQLVAEMQGLANDERPIGARIADAKRLQQNWREVGITPRRQDRKLWEEFRAAADAVFQARDAEHEAEQKARTDNLSAATALVDAFAANVADGSPTLSDFHALRNKVRDSGAMPRDPARALHQRIDELHDVIAQRAAEDARGAVLDTLRALKSLDERVADAEASGTSADIGDAELAEAFANRSNREADPEAARRLVLRSEIHAGIDSPEGDQATRLELQVEAINKSLNEAVGDETDPLVLAYEWCSLGRRSTDDAALRNRLFAALERLASEN